MYEEHYHRVLGYALRRTDRDDAADIVAETFLVAWRRFDAVPEGEGALLWLYGTARRVLANHKRSSRRRARLTERIRAERVHGVPSSVDDARLGAAATAFARLRADDRELLALVAWEALDAGQVGQVLGCSRNAARIRLHRARRRFARELERVEGPAKRNSVGGHVAEAYE